MSERENKSNGTPSLKSPTTDTRKFIKVIGVGGGGGDVVKRMYRRGIDGVSFALCNTDRQHMEDSEVPVKLVLGPHVTHGLGSGNDLKRAAEAAQESEPEIRAMLNDGTQMVFVVATMGGGTGTGAAPVIARIAREMDILTVGFVTIPFLFEGHDKIMQALNGVDEMSRHADSLFVLHNERLIMNREVNISSIRQAFNQADNMLFMIIENMLEMITLVGEINLDFVDLSTLLKNGGIAQMGAGYGKGKNRMGTAIREAFDSPLLSHDFSHAKKLLFLIISSTGEDGLGIKELECIQKFIEDFAQYIPVIWGLAYDDSLGEQVKFIALASGFDMDRDREDYRTIMEKR